jgi:acetolactate synthase I/II/III large subunit
LAWNRREALAALGAAGTVAIPAALRGQDLPPLPDPGMSVAPPAPPVPPPTFDGRVRGRMTGAMAAVRALMTECVPCVYGIPGAQNNEFWDAMKSERLAYFLVTQEGSASIMADASARVTGRVGAFAVVPGPGLTNALTGMGEAWMDTVPIVGIVTDVERGPNAPIGQVHGLFNSALLRPVSKVVVEVGHVGQIAEAIHHAFRVARSGAPGPASVVIPYNHLIETWDFDEPVPYDLAPPWDEAAYRRAVGMLQDKRKRIGIFAGMGCVSAAQQLPQVADMLQAPVATTVSGKGVIPDSHPLSVGWGYGSYGTRAAERTFKEVDIVLAVGTRFSEVSTANYSIPDRPELIHVDIDPSVLGKNARACVGVNADSGQFFDRLLSDASLLARECDPGLARTIEKRRDADRAQYEQVETRGGVDPMFFLSTLSRGLAKTALLFMDVTASTHWAAEAFELSGPRRYFTPADNQSMGWAIPASIGAQRLDPSRPVACITGDGCFLMTGLEVSSAARSALPVKFFVFDDGAYHYMQMLQEPVYGRTTATEIARLDFRAMAAGLGVGYNEILTNEDVGPGLSRSFCSGGPVLTRVTISYDGREIRWLKALRRSYLDGLSRGQVLRVASRGAIRAANPLLRND